VLRQLLANTWARQAAIQCSFNQDSLDLLIPAYHGSVTPGAIFYPALLTGIVVQIKFKTTGDKQVGDSLRPLGIPRGLERPLPYLAILLELGNESEYQETRSKIKTTASKRVGRDQFQKLIDEWISALKKHQKQTKETLKKLEAAVTEARSAIESCNRYSIFVRGTSPEVYGILNEAGIAKEFKTLFSVTMPSPTDCTDTMQCMRPFERLGKSTHMAWMTEFPEEEPEDSDENDVSDSKDDDIEDVEMTGEGD
jgi:hypothetical protein